MRAERASAVMAAMVAMFSTGDLTDLASTVETTYLDHQGLGGGKAVEHWGAHS